MIIQDFLSWIDTAASGLRADAAHALGRAYVFREATDEMLEAMEAALTVLLDDPSPDVRFALADALATSPDAPRHVILALAADRVDIAATVIARSPVLFDSELVDLVAGCDALVQMCIAGRPTVSIAVAAAIAEVGEPEACRVLIANDGAAIARISVRRIVQRFGDDAIIRNGLLARPDLPADLRQMLIRRLGEVLGAFVTERAWVGADRARQVVGDACDRATVALAAETESDELPALVEHLRVTGQLTTSLLLRAVCAGNVGLFITAVASLSATPEARVQALAFGNRTGLRAAYLKAKLPAAAFDAFVAALDASHTFDLHDVDPAMRYRMTRRLIDAVLERYRSITDNEMNDLMGMLRRFAADAARAAAREYVDAARAA